jgi:bifunctional non-homologous end joining protein LigD
MPRTPNSSLATPAPRRRASDRTPNVLEQLETIERGSGDGILAFGRGVTLPVSSLGRLVWPRDGITKGALMRYYACVAPALLPLLEDRPLVLERHPRGVTGPSFHQHAPGENVPPSVRVADVEMDDGTTELRFVGGDPALRSGQALATLLYTIQLGAIAVNPWHARLGHLEHPDYMVLDLDPMPRVPASRIIRLARLVSEHLVGLGLRHGLKTSGSRGIHLVVPLPARTTWEVSATLAERVATAVATAHPDIATVERRMAERPKGTIYLDHRQNGRGQTLVATWSVRAKAGAPVSTPVTCAELESGEADPRGWNVKTIPEQLAARKRTWAAAFRGGNDAATVKAALAR